MKINKIQLPRVLSCSCVTFIRHGSLSAVLAHTIVDDGTGHISANGSKQCHGSSVLMSNGIHNPECHPVFYYHQFTGPL